jgi:zinc transport system permease protein
MVFDLIQYGFMQRALISAIAISVICAIVGLFLVLKRHSLFGDALAHVAFGGISLEYIHYGRLILLPSYLQLE